MLHNRADECTALNTHSSVQAKIDNHPNLVLVVLPVVVFVSISQLSLLRLRRTNGRR